MEQSKKVEVIRFCDFEIDGIDYDDAPKYVDAYICNANVELSDGTYRKATDEELEQLNEDYDLVSELVYAKLY